MLMIVIAHGGCTDTVRASALKVDSGRKIPCRTGDSNPRQYHTWPRRSTDWAIPAPSWLVKCCFTSTETVDLLGTGAQDGHLDFHTVPEFWLIDSWLSVALRPQKP